MIGVVRSGSGFGGLARYLATGKRGDEHDRVAWTEAYNLMETDPERAARLMRATAGQNPRVAKPVYHLSVSFAPEDGVGPEQMRQVAERLLRDLGLGEHQAFLIAHRDTAHPHFHLMINRVHPETLRAWHTGHDYARVGQLLDRYERELGLRRAAYRSPSDRHRRPDSPMALTGGERRERARTGVEPWSERTRVRLAGAFKEARSWAELEHRLRRAGFRLRPRGRGLVVTDGRRSMKASRISRSASAHGLAERFAISYADYRAARGDLVVAARDLRAPPRETAPPRSRVRRPPAPTRVAPFAAARSGLRLGAQAADLLARPGGLKAARLALSLSRTLPAARGTANARAVQAALRLGLDGLSFVLRPGPLKAVRIALALTRTLSVERER